MHSVVYNDYLTGISNRLSLSVEITKMLTISKENESQLAFICIDLDNFKDINELYGHSVGNEILKKIAQKLKKYASDKGILVGRFGGDEFAVVVPNLKSYDYVTNVCEDIKKHVNSIYDIFDSNVTINISIGVSIYPKDCDNYEDLVRQADMSVHVAKEQGKNRIVFYDEEIGKANFKRIKIEMNIRSALDNEEFVLHYQPKVSVDGKSILGFEALIRWKAKNNALIPPNTPMLASPMIIPAIITPSITATTLFLKSISKKLAARVPVHAPVPGRGIPTKSIRAINNPLPAFAWSFLPPFSPFSIQKVKNLPINFLSLPQSKTFLAKKKIKGTGSMFPTIQIT